MTQHWTNKFVGIPYNAHGRARQTGVDCWGLACVVYQEELGITLPEYLGYSSVDEHCEISALIAGATAMPLWVPVTGPAMAFDIAVFRRGRLDSHVGLIIRRGWMLHMVDEDCAKVQQCDRGAWGHRHSSTWRHVDLISRGGVQ